MADNKIVPSIRFKEFEELYEKNGGDANPKNPYAWEQRKLRELAEFNPRATLPDSFEYVDLESVVGTDLISHRRESKLTAPSRAQRLARKGDVFYQTVRPYQKNNYLFDLPYDNYVFSTGYAQLRSWVDSYFLLSRLQEERFVSDVLDRSTGTSYPAINSNDLAEIEVSVTSNDIEQQLIGTFFKQLDHTITLHQRKLEHLEKMKKGLLQKMFPKKGADVPEIRFPGYTDAWEQCKLGEIYVRNNERNNGQFSIDKTISIANMYFKKSGNGATSESTNSYKVLRVGDIAFEGHKNKNFSYGRMVMNDIGDGIMSPRFTTLRPIDKQVISFWKKLIHYEPIMKYILVHSTKKGTMMNELVINDFMKTNIRVPSESEQEKIGSFLTDIDYLIALHQRKLNKLKDIKKALLEKMFV